MARITIDLDLVEREALIESARRAHRDPRGYAALLLVRGLRHEGLLPEVGPSLESPLVLDHEARISRLERELPGGQSWTMVPPTVNGWYWCVSGVGDIEMGCLYIESVDGEVFFWVGNDNCKLSDFTHWLGPLPKPAPPPDQPPTLFPQTYFASC